jgi:tryptophan-rich sensory protein
MELLNWQRIQEEFLGKKWLGYYLILIVLYLITLYYSAVGVNSKWYQRLKQPPWAPGLIVTAIIGVVVYVLSFWGLYLAFEKVYQNVEENIQIYDFFMITITLTTGFLSIWTYLFFISRQVLLATIFTLIGFILYFAVVVQMLILDPVAGALNIPYLIWLGYFFVFSAWIYLENPAELVGSPIV